MSTPELSIVIATYDRVGLLPRTIAALAGQTGDVPFEVIVVDDGSSDGTGGLLDEAARQHAFLRHHRIPHSGSPGAPRNAGIRLARGRIVVLVDDDVIVDAGFVRAHAEFHRAHPSPMAAALGELYLSPDIAADPLSVFHAFPYDEVRAMPRLNYLFFWTCNVSVKREMLLAHGLFDESPELHPYEDMDCGWRLERAGLQLQFLPTARGCHAHQLSPGDVVAKGLRSGRAQFALMSRVPDPGAKVRFGILSRDLPVSVLVPRLCKRVLFWLADSVPVRAALQAAMRRSPTRSRWSDYYNYLLFRRGVLRGYRAARREAPVSQPRAARLA